MTDRTAKLTLRNYSGEVRTHRHDFHQFVLPVAGALELEADGKGGVVDNVRGALVRAEQDHAFLGRGATRCAVLDVPATVHEWLENAAASRSPFFPIDPALHHLLQFISLRGDRDSGVEALLLTTALGSLGADGGEPRQLRRALRFMEAQCHRPITVAEIADAAALGESRLYDLFRIWVGTGPKSHLTALRIRRAKTALHAGDLSIAEIAHRAGFSDQTAFTRAFKRHTGRTPAAYRRGSGA